MADADETGEFYCGCEHHRIGTERASWDEDGCCTSCGVDVDPWTIRAIQAEAEVEALRRALLDALQWALGCLDEGQALAGEWERRAARDDEMLHEAPMIFRECAAALRRALESACRKPTRPNVQRGRRSNSPADSRSRERTSRGRERRDAMMCVHGRSGLCPHCAASVPPPAPAAPPGVTPLDDAETTEAMLAAAVDRLRARLSEVERERDEANAAADEKHARLVKCGDDLRAAESRCLALAGALRGLEDLYPDDAGASAFLDREGVRFYRETGVWPVFKSAPLAMHHEHEESERSARWHEWLAVQRAKAHATARAALAEHGAGDAEGER